MNTKESNKLYFNFHKKTLKLLEIIFIQEENENMHCRC